MPETRHFFHIFKGRAVIPLNVLTKGHSWKGVKFLTKKELADEVAKSAKLKKKDAEAAVDATLDSITKALKKGQKVQLVGFGTFEVRKRKARTGINPQTKAKIKIAASKAPAFRPGKALKDAIAKK
jgi:DNA-binding protein HU-beta